MTAERRRKIVRRLALAALALVLLLVALAGGALLYLNSAAGGERVRQEVLAALKGAVQGSLDVGGIDIHGEELILRDLKLYDPEHALVAEISEVRLRLALSALLRRRLLLREAVIHEPKLYLVQDDRGLNLSRAIASKAAQVEKE